MPAPLLNTKLYLPPARLNAVQRTRLANRFRADTARLLLITAPAGFGKSTLAVQILNQTSLPCGWVSLDEADREPGRFLSYVIASIQSSYPEFASSELAELQSSTPPPADTVLLSMLNQLTELNEPFVLVLDDYHVIESESVDSLLAQFVDYMPPKFKLIMTTREDPNLPLSRLRVRGQLTELRAADLRFTADEADEFLNRIMALKLTAEEIHALESRTEGWVAGLQLAALSLQGQTDKHDFILNFTGSHHFILDYLIEETLQRQSPAVQNFLLNTSILTRLNAPICAALCETGIDEATQLLKQLEQANLFLIPLDADRRSWRYHHLFADVLKARLRSLDPERIDILHLRASEWYQHNGQPNDAIFHASIAGDYPGMADQIERAWPDADRYIQSAPWLGWLNQLPEHLLDQRPVLQSIFVWALLDVGEIEQAEHRLIRLTNWTERHQHDNRLPSNPPADITIIDKQQYQRLLASMSTARGYIAQTRGDIQGAIEHHTQTFDLFEDKSDIDFIAADGLLALSYLTAGELDKAYSYFNEVMLRLKQRGHTETMIGGCMILTDLSLILGQLYDVRKTIEDYKNLLPAQRPYPQGAIYLYIAEAKLYLARYQLTDAEQALNKAVDVDLDSPLLLGKYRQTITRAALAHARGNLHKALSLLDQAETFYYPNVVPEFHPVGAQRVRVLIKLGQTREAWQWARDQNLSDKDSLNFLKEFDHITLAQLMIATGSAANDAQQLLDASALLERLEQASSAGNRNAHLIDILIQQAVAFQQLGQDSRATEVLSRAVSLAAEADLVLPFIFEYPSVASMLDTIVKQTKLQPFIQRIYSQHSELDRESTLARHLSSPTSAAPHSDLGAALIEPLSKRETEVLRLIAEGLSNQEISDRLFLALSSVKGHNQKIFGKLQVQRRTEAVARARELSLI